MKKLTEFEKAGEGVLQEQAEAVKALEADEEKEKQRHAKRLKLMQGQAALKQKHLEKERLCKQNIDVAGRKREAMTVTTLCKSTEPIAQLIGADNKSIRMKRKPA